MSSAWIIYSGALLVLLSAGIMMLMGRPATAAWRDVPSIACGVALFALVCTLSLVFSAPPSTAVSGACFWMAATITITHTLRGRIGSRG